MGGANYAIPFLDVLSRPAHLRAYALMMALVCSTFAMMPYLPKFLIDNIGFRLGHLQLMYLVGGIAAFVSMNVVDRLTDHYPRLLVFRILASATLMPLMLLSLLPHGTPPVVVLLITTLIFILTSGRMVPAIAMITSTAVPAYRGGFMSVNAAVQLFGTGVAPVLASFLMPDARPDEPLAGYPLVASVCVAVGLLAVYLGGWFAPPLRTRRAWRWGNNGWWGRSMHVPHQRHDRATFWRGAAGVAAMSDRFLVCCHAASVLRPGTPAVRIVASGAGSVSWTI